ncbi:MAG: threonine/serine dehydratase [Promethearchaeota archaeon]
MSIKYSLHNIDFKKETIAAEDRIKTVVRETPLEYSPTLSKLGECRVYLKLENLQKTGSFKLRGAANFVLNLSKKDLDKGVVTVSSGNHAAALTYLSNQFKFKGTIYLPENASTAKVDALLDYGADLKFYGTDVGDTEFYAKEIAQKNHQTFVPPYNHIKIIAGQATVAMEVKNQLKEVDVVFAPIGGGGLASGIAGYLKSVDENIEVIGCLPKNSPVMYESVKAGRIVEMESKPTLSDGTAGGIEKDAITFEICKKYVDNYLLVSEDEIKKAVIYVLEKHYMLIEGAAALSVASFIKLKNKFKNKNVVLIISGKKIGLDRLKGILCK